MSSVPPSSRARSNLPNVVICRRIGKTVAAMEKTGRVARKPGDRTKRVRVKGSMASASCQCEVVVVGVCRESVGHTIELWEELCLQGKA
jgi:hypothetical protein